jgi:hypothetical protein
VLNEMMGIAPELSHCLDRAVRFVIPMLSDCRKGDILTPGYRVASAAESANAMIRNHLPRKSLRLCELRPIITIAYAYKSGIRFRPILMSDEMRDILRTTHLNLENNIIQILATSIRKSKCIHIERRPEGIIVINGRGVYQLEPGRCQCGYPVCWGLPCHYLIAAYRHFSNPFPAFRVHHRWLRESLLHPFPTGEFPRRTLEQLADESSGWSEAWDESVSEDQDVELAIRSIMDVGDEPPPPRDVSDDEEPRYDRDWSQWIIQQGKEIACLGQSGRKFVWVMEQMNGILQELVTEAKDWPAPETEQKAERKAGHESADIQTRPTKRGDRKQNAFSVKGRDTS